MICIQEGCLVVSNIALSALQIGLKSLRCCSSTDSAHDVDVQHAPAKPQVFAELTRSSLVFKRNLQPNLQHLLLLVD